MHRRELLNFDQEFLKIKISIQVFAQITELLAFTNRTLINFQTEVEDCFLECEILLEFLTLSKFLRILRFNDGTSMHRHCFINAAVLDCIKFYSTMQKLGEMFIFILLYCCLFHKTSKCCGKIYLTYEVRESLNSFKDFFLPSALF